MASGIIVCIVLLVIVFFVDESELKPYFNWFNKTKRPSGPPHVVFILADDMGWNDVSFHGSDQIPTPNIDALAFNGVILNNHYVQPICTPTRSALLTGKYPIHTGMQGQPLLASERRGLPLQEKTIAQHMKKLGYTTRLVGKWHLGYYQIDYTPLRRGFDSHLGYWNGAISYYDHIMQDLGTYGNYSGYDFRRNFTTAWDCQGKYATDIFTEEAENIIQNHNIETPLFLYLAHLAVHAGNEGKLLEAPQETIDKFRHITNPNRRSYAAMVSKLDESVGRVVHALQERDMLSNSIIVFLSDNGAPLTGVFRNWGSNQPYRGEKGTLWEGAVRTPALIWSPLIEATSRVSKQLMHVTDWLPTLYTAAGGNKEDLSKELDGINMWPTLVENKESPRKNVVVNIDGGYGALIVRKDNESNETEGVYKIIIGKSEITNNVIFLDSSLKHPYKTEDVLNSLVNVAINNAINSAVNATLIQKLRNEATVVCPRASNMSFCKDKCLFDLDNDPCELNDISKTNSMVMTYMEDMYEKQLQTMVPKLKTVLDAAANPALFNYTWNIWEPMTEFDILTNDNSSDDRSLYEYQHIAQ